MRVGNGSLLNGCSRSSQGLPKMATKPKDNYCVSQPTCKKIIEFILTIMIIAQKVVYLFDL
jgi:hypothetical protein